MSDDMAHPRSVLIAAGQVITPHAVLAPGWVEVRGDRIVTTGQGLPPRTPDVERPSDIAVPGFVDTHAHGGGGASFSTTNPDEAFRAASAHLAHGTTSMIASLVTAPLTDLARQGAILADLVSQGILAGIHLEGPWLSPGFKGAHDPRHLVTPDAESVTTLLTAGRGAVRMVTLAPELHHGVEAIRRIVDHGAVAAVGHTAADYDLTRVAIDAGATVATHLFNAMPPLHHRRPGPVLALLEDPRVTVEIIADGVHLHPQIASFAMRSAMGGFSLVTDAMAAAAAQDGHYRLGGLDVEVRDGVATLAGSETIAGSTLTMHQALRRAVAAGATLPEAVRAATATPADRLGLPDVGSLEAGRRADLVLLSQDLELQGVLHRGAWR
jgi:N-acetylglucosamine-6-phosphate deacetylase